MHQGRLKILVAGTAFLVVLAYFGLSTEVRIQQESIHSEAHNKRSQERLTVDSQADFSEDHGEAGSAVYVTVKESDPANSALHNDWARTFFSNSETGVIADRYRFVDVDWFELIRQVQASPAYLAAASGTAPPRASNDASPDIILPLFDDLALSMKIAAVDIRESGGLERWILRGTVINEKDSHFRITIRSNPNRMSGQIGTVNRHIKIATPPNGTSTTLVADFDKKRYDSMRQPID